MGVIGGGARAVLSQLKILLLENTYRYECRVTCEVQVRGGWQRLAEEHNETTVEMVGAQGQ